MGAGDILCAESALEVGASLASVAGASDEAPSTLTAVVCAESAVIALCAESEMTGVFVEMSFSKAAVDTSSESEVGLCDSMAPLLTVVMVVASLIPVAGLAVVSSGVEAKSVVTGGRGGGDPFPCDWCGDEQGLVLPSCSGFGTGVQSGDTVAGGGDTG